MNELVKPDSEASPDYVNPGPPGGGGGGGGCSCNSECLNNTSCHEFTCYLDVSLPWPF